MVFQTEDLLREALTSEIGKKMTRSKHLLARHATIIDAFAHQERMISPGSE